MKKRKIIIPALLTIAACTSIAAGSTYALFTSESSTNIAVTSGKVDVVASLSNLEAYSPTSIQSDGTVSNEANSADNTTDTKTFSNGGNASISGNTLKLNNVTPGDKASFEINVKNQSTVKVLYRIIIGCKNDNGLFEGLNVSLDAGKLEFDQNISGITVISKYVEIEPSSSDKTLKLSVELPATADSSYSGKECEIECIVEAVQGNALVEEISDDTIELYSATDLVSYSKLESECTTTDSTLYNYTNFELMNDIDMTGIDWTPIMGRNNINTFKKATIVFEGNNHTISNLTANKVSNGSNYFSGFFGYAANTNIQNLTIVNETINSTHYAGGIVGQLQYASKVTNCKVINSTIVSTPELINGEYDNGDKVGGLVGHFESNGAVISNCSVESTSITGYRDIGGLVGYAGADLTLLNNTVKDTTITSDITYNYKNYKEETKTSANLGNFIGRTADWTGESLSSGNTYNNVTLNYLYKGNAD